MRTNEQATLYLVGLRIEPEIFEPQLYTIYVDDDRPITYKRQPILFVRPDLAEAALQKSDCGAAAFGPAPGEVYTVYDFAEALYTLRHRDEDQDSSLLDCINLVLDFCTVTEGTFPAGYRHCLESLADQLTFDRSFGEFVERNGISRTTVTDALYWSIGMIACQMKLLI